MVRKKVCITVKKHPALCGTNMSVRRHRWLGLGNATWLWLWLWKRLPMLLKKKQALSGMNAAGKAAVCR